MVFINLNESYKMSSISLKNQIPPIFREIIQIPENYRFNARWPFSNPFFKPKIRVLCLKLGFLLQYIGHLRYLVYLTQNAHYKNFPVSKCYGFLYYYVNNADGQGGQYCVTGRGDDHLDCSCTDCSNYNEYTD